MVVEVVAGAKTRQREQGLISPIVESLNNITLGEQQRFVGAHVVRENRLSARQSSSTPEVERKKRNSRRVASHALANSITFRRSSSSPAARIGQIVDALEERQRLFERLVQEFLRLDEIFGENVAGNVGIGDVDAVSTWYHLKLIALKVLFRDVVALAIDQDTLDGRDCHYRQ